MTTTAPRATDHAIRQIASDVVAAAGRNPATVGTKIARLARNGTISRAEAVRVQTVVDENHNYSLDEHNTMIDSYIAAMRQ